MNMDWRMCLEEAGVDVAKALERMMGSEALFSRLMGKFLEDPNYAALCAALERADTAGATAAAHTLKGICGNLSMTALLQLFTRQVEALRGGDLASARAMMAQITPAYEAVAAAIREQRDEVG